MKSISFPKMIRGNSTAVLSGKEATKQNLINLLGTEQGELFGDPEFGLRLKRYIYDQNNYVLKDIIIDDIYSQIKLFIPQIIVNRRDITIIQNKDGGRATLYAHIKATNRADFTPNTYDLVLLREEE